MDQSYPLVRRPTLPASIPVSRRSAFTLLELLLTLAVISAIAAVTIPQVGWLLGDRRLVRSADQLRVEMTRLRLKAMRGGQVMILEGMLDGGNLRARPYFSPADATESGTGSGGPSALLSGAKQAAVAPVIQDESQVETIELPDDVTVEAVAVVSAARAAEIEQNTMAEQTQGWSRPVLFYTDGTTSTAAVTLRHESMGSIVVKLRGITGDAMVGEIQP